MFARVGAVGLAEAVEDMRQKVCADSLPRVAHDDLGAASLSRQCDAHLAAFGGELDSIRQQVPDNLLQAVGVAVNFVVRLRKLYAQANLFSGGGGADGFDGGFD